MPYSSFYGYVRGLDAATRRIVYALFVRRSVQIQRRCGVAWQTKEVAIWVYGIYQRQVAPTAAVVSKSFRLISFSSQLIWLATSVGGFKAYSSLVGRIRPLLHLMLLVADIPVLWRDDGIQAMLFGSKKKPNQRQRVLDIATLTGLAHKLIKVSRGLCDLLRQFPALKGFSKSYDRLGRIGAVTSLAQHMANIAVCFQLLASRRSEKDKRLVLIKAADDFCDGAHTAISSDYISSFEGDSWVATLLGFGACVLSMSRYILRAHQA